MLRSPPTSTLFPYTTLFRSSTNIATIDESATLEDAMESMKAHGCRHLPVMRDSKVVGFLRSEEHTSELQSPMYLVCRLLLEKKNRAGPVASVRQLNQLRHRS